MRKVQMILRDKPKNLNAAKIEQKHMSVEGKQIRVAAYCRVSTEMESQQSSMEAQVRFFREQIQRHKGWELVGIYADEGISGGTAARRPEFQRLLRDCEEGKVDYIISKSISRFARNTLECLSIIRHLQSIGVQLIFEKENIDTGNAFSEMLLTVLAAFAQEESRSLSENQKWSIRKRFEEGDPRWHLLYGYRPDDSRRRRNPPFRRLLQFAGHSCRTGISPCPEDICEAPLTGRTPWAGCRKSRQ